MSDADWREFVERVQSGLIPKLRDSAMTVSLVPLDHDGVDIKFAVELGLSIMYDKPIIAVIDPGTVVPDHLARVADLIIEGPVNAPGFHDRLHDAIDMIAGAQ